MDTFTTPVTCSISGLTIQIPYSVHTPMQRTDLLTNGGTDIQTLYKFTHPALALTISDLEANIHLLNSRQPPFHEEHSAGDINHYLYLLSWFTKLPSVTFKTSLNPQTAYITLIKYSTKLINVVRAVANEPNLNFPALIIRNPDDFDECLEAWLHVYTDTIKEADLYAKLTNRLRTVSLLEETLTNTVDLHNDAVAKRNAKLISDWAALVSDFPKEVKELWKGIIYNTFRNDVPALFKLSVTRGDYSELLYHCEEYIPHGTDYAYELMKRLRNTTEIIKDLTYYSNSSVEIIKPKYPEPNRKDFSSSVQYMKAKIRWQAEHVRVSRTDPDDSVYMDI